MTGVQALSRILQTNRNGYQAGLPSYCTAHPDVLLAIMREYKGSEDPILIEATCNQVNQYGGYTGMTPADFVAFIRALAEQAEVDTDRLILGGDHLGPNPWRDRSAKEAMQKAIAMVSAYAKAGFTKVHLDASMTCSDDGPLTEQAIAQRAAMMCLACEGASGPSKPCYVIGSEVPVPGGEKGGHDSIDVTDPKAVKHTIDAHRVSFDGVDLTDAFTRVVAIVTQPGVDFSNTAITRFAAEKVGALSAALFHHEGIVYEAHSTDYQDLTALRALVNANFAILKVGPELTYAYREAVQLLAQIEAQLNVESPSHIMAVVSDALDRNPGVWRDYIGANENPQFARLSGLSDRVRYVWQDAQVKTAIDVLRHNINKLPKDSNLLNNGFRTVPSSSNYEAIVQAKVGRVVRRYRAACGEISIINEQWRV